MQLEKEKKEKRERERCRALAQRIAEEANPASAALLGEQMSLLTEALHRAGVEAEEWTEGSAAELLVVADPAWETLPETLPARVLLGKVQTPWQIALPFAVAAAFLWGAGRAFRRGMRRYLTHSCNRYRDMGFRN